MTVNQRKIYLRKITADNVRSICELAVKKDQRDYVVSNAIAVAEACYSKEQWIRAIYLNEKPIGLAVLKIKSDHSIFFLWRLMIDARYQNLDFGRQTIALLIEHVKTKSNAVEFSTSIVPGENSPQGFYETLGFQVTDEKEGDEVIMRLSI